ncbi:hypothetical protein IP81_04255 [Novosphingobium sp. AAP83]|uniref:CmcJ/NvfI family oxidoreductase n=1 Tax=Novosphingobium sp. AAP83 TaxID=1523425 RepID=UPI0006B9B7CE|nr:CmcJ/NvfI family oxidoreductase [Novosphingobium sp. AAP83]KPF93421.1 hypothetical protein IP81_04255 [Novosphingobium sp. AAP83]
MSDRQTVTSTLGFSELLDQRMEFFANDNSRDRMNVTQRTVEIENVRARATPTSLEKEGFALVPHKSAVTDFRDQDQVERIHPAEILALLQQVSGADHVEVTGPPILRFSERSNDSGALDNSRPARYVHVDISDETGARFNAQSRAPEGRRITRIARYNVWRVLTPPPQDVPLAVCESASVAREDLLPAWAMFDRDGEIVFSFEAWVLRYNPGQRWAYFADMTPDEALVFKTHDTDPSQPSHVPHGAFDDPSCPGGVPPRGSVEMRGVAYWYE